MRPNTSHIKKTTAEKDYYQIALDTRSIRDTVKGIAAQRGKYTNKEQEVNLLNLFVFSARRAMKRGNDGAVSTALLSVPAIITKGFAKRIKSEKSAAFKLAVNELCIVVGKMVKYSNDNNVTFGPEASAEILNHYNDLCNALDRKCVKTFSANHTSRKASYC